MRGSILTRPLGWLSLATGLASAQVIDSLSFGHEGTISSDGQTLPGWQVGNSNHKIQILSDRLILTPPDPGNARGSLWSQTPTDSESWTVDLDFRTWGQDGGSGNLQLWYIKEKKQDTHSVYTVDKFDGLVLVIDKNVGRGGIKGFLNDGTQNFKAHSSIASLGFGQCEYNYRNLGRPSRLKITNHDGFTVTIDERECFSSDKISLPSGYYFGITASTPEVPDSFEIEKFVVTRSAVEPVQEYGHMQQRSENTQHKQKPPSLQKLDRLPGAPEILPDQVADEIHGDVDQFADLHNRMQTLSHQLGNVFAELEVLASRIDDRHQQILDAIASKPVAAASGDFQGLDQRLDQLHRSMEQVRRDLEGKDYRDTLAQMNRAIESVRGGLTDALPNQISGIMSKSAPRMGYFVAVIIAVQITLAGAYVFYKRRRNSMPKKYL